MCEVRHPPITLKKSMHVFTYVEFILELLDIDRVNIIYLRKSDMGFFRVCTFVYATTFQRFCWPKEDSMLTNSFVMGRLSPTPKKKNFNLKPLEPLPKTIVVILLGVAKNIIDIGGVGKFCRRID